jgi:hypothetical protein
VWIGKYGLHQNNTSPIELMDRSGYGPAGDAQKQLMKALSVPKKYLKNNPLSEPEDYWIEDESQN